MKLFRNDKEHGDVVRFVKTGKTKDVRQQGQSAPLETFYEYELVSTKKVSPEMASYQIDDDGKRISLDIADEEPQKTDDGFLIRVFAKC